MKISDRPLESGDNFDQDTGVGIAPARQGGRRAGQPRHTLDAELTFLERLGSWSIQGARIPRAELLKGYLAGIAHREHGFTAGQIGMLRERVAVLLRQA